MSIKQVLVNKKILESPQSNDSDTRELNWIITSAAIVDIHHNPEAGDPSGGSPVREIF